MLIFISTLLFFFASCSFNALSDLVLKTESPDGLYRVELTGNGERPVFGTNSVDLAAFKQGKPYFGNEYFHSGDAFDISFNLGYPEHQWVRNNILRFFRPLDAKFGKEFAVTVINGTNSEVVFMKLFCTDKFVLLDLPRDSKYPLNCSASLGDMISIFVEGKFKDGRRFKGGSGFPAAVNRDSLVVEILEEGVSIREQK